MPAHPAPTESQARSASLEVLDNPIWNALITDHASLAQGDALARRYPEDIGPLCGIAEESHDAWHSLHALLHPGQTAGLFLQSPVQLAPGWTLLRTAILGQMFAPEPLFARLEVPSGFHLRRLTPDDAPAMVDLAALTEPGPFRLRTLELGTFYGILQSDRLVAMAGKRLHVPGAIEVSGVCTHPDARGRGFARLLMSRVMEEMVEAGRTPFLHTLADNHSAIRVYESLGFVHRRAFHLAVVRRDG